MKIEIEKKGNGIHSYLLMTTTWYEQTEEDLDVLLKINSIVQAYNREAIERA